MAEEEYADVILCSNIWPKQAKVMHFRGRQNQNQKSGNSAAERQNTKKITTNSVVASKTQTTMDRFLTQKQAPTQVPTYANVTVRNKRKQLTSVADEIENYDDYAGKLVLSESESETNADPECESETDTNPTEDATPNKSIHRPE